MSDLSRLNPIVIYGLEALISAYKEFDTYLSGASSGEITASATAFMLILRSIAAL